MTLFKQDNNLQLRQGDTGNIGFKRLPTDKPYNVYFSIYDPDLNTILKEVMATSFSQQTGVAVVTFNEDFSNSLPVGEWVWGLKICADGSEDTLIPRTYTDNGIVINESAPKFTVLDKYVEGD